MNRRLRQIVLGALFMALGLVVPMLFHGLGIGAIFLPMFWPLALAGYWLSPPVALAAGLFTPALSSLITGMPPAPVVWRMMAELAVLPTLTSLLHQKTRWPAVAVTALSLLASLAAGLALAAALAPILGWPPRLYALASLGRSLPGTLGMILLIPPLYQRLARGTLSRRPPHDARP